MRTQNTVRDRRRLMPTLARAFGAMLVAGATAAGSGAAQAQQLIRDPHYGDGLFFYYQQRYLDTVTQIMVSQHFARLPRHGDEAEILRGGLLLSFGLHQEAGEIFERLIERGAPLPVRDRAWFYLAKIRYQRGLPKLAEAALERIQGALPADLDEERSLLHGNLLMQRGEFAQAARVLAALGRRGNTSLFARFNLGVALIRSGDRARGSAVLETLGVMPAATEETWTLRDRANVALGFAALQYNDPQSARAPLERVRLSSLQANQALLGFGWAAVALKQPKEALRPWLELETRDPSDASVLEARLAVPYAMAELGAVGQAIERYHRALDEFDRENARLDESIAAVRAGRLLDGLMANNPAAEMGWFWNIGTLPQVPHAAHLTPVLAQHEFQEAFKNYRDLHFLARNLRERQTDVPVLRDMLANRHEAFAQRLPAVLAHESRIDLETPAALREPLARELAQAERDADGVALADARSRRTLDQVRRVREIVDAMGAITGVSAVERAAAQERLRRVAGVLSWQLVREHPLGAWEAKKGMQVLDASLESARRNQAALAAAKRDEPARLVQFTARLDALDRQIPVLAARIAELTVAQRAELEALAVQALVQQKERLADYTAQARFAIAQITDRASVTPEGGARVKP